MNSIKIGFLQGRLTKSTDGDIQFFPFDNWENEFKIASDLGFDCIELLVKSNSYKENPIWSDAGVGRILELSKKFNLSVPSVHGFYIKKPEYTDILIELIKRSSMVGAQAVLISFFEERALNNMEDKLTAVNLIKPALDIARELNVTLGIETEMPAEELKEFVDMFDSKNVGVYYDIGNMVSMGVDVVKEIELLKNYICGVHIKDRLVGKGTVPIGEGDSDFPVIFLALKNINYKKPLIFQGARKEGVDDIELNKSYLKTVKNWLLEINY